MVSWSVILRKPNKKSAIVRLSRQSSKRKHLIIDLRPELTRIATSNLLKRKTSLYVARDFASVQQI